MPALASELRKQFENVIIQARDKAEEAARSALKKRAVESAEPFPHFGQPEKNLRNRLRARGRQVGDIVQSNKTQSIDYLTEELAYEYWHRMLFARFLAENHLLMHPDGVAVSLAECDELAQSEGTLNGFVLAARYASRMLPQVFRNDDVLLEIEFAPEHRIPLEKLLASVPPATFLADDSLGWVYQFWQTKRKAEVNKSGVKIDGHKLPAVTQLFTEHYMVQFLLHNTIGAWWCARHGIRGSSGGAGIPAGKASVEMAYLRWRNDGTAAGGHFEGWPDSLSEFTMLDPCCGSGHFLVTTFNLLVPLRMHDEGLSARDACDAVLKENLFGLELDPRCTQIAAFALAFAAWKYPDENGQALGYRILPQLNIACSGLGPGAGKDEWLKLGRGDTLVVDGMERLYELFQKAPTLGSLINPRRLGGELLVAQFHDLEPLLERALALETTDETARELAVTARGLTKAAEILGRQFTLVATNVPYLGRAEQDEILRDYCNQFHGSARNDLATCFVERCLDLCAVGGSTAVVTPQSWLFQHGYKKLRKELLECYRWEFLARLGPRAFETISGEVVNVFLLALSRIKADAKHSFTGIDVTDQLSTSEKQRALLEVSLVAAVQADQLSNPDSRITLDVLESKQLLSKCAVCIQGLATSDDPQFTCYFWEFPVLTNGWEGLMGTVETTCLAGGRERVIRWENGTGRYYRHAQALKAEGRLGGWKSGTEARGKKGVLVSQMSTMPVTIYTGEFYDHNASVIVAGDERNLPAIWAFASSSEFTQEVRKLDRSLKPSNNVFVKVPFDLKRWQEIAADKYPHGLPELHSDDPTQWLFSGHPLNSKEPLQVAVARLLGYGWPRQEGASFPDCPALSSDGLGSLADVDGIACIPPVRGESPCAERLLELLRTAYADRWSDSLPHELLTKAGSKPGTTLDDWLRNSFFEQHCKLFLQRPFIWHIWDGRKDGFSCLVNYHNFTHKMLENLTYSYVQDWIKAQAADAKAGKIGADLRLKAAQDLQDKLKLVLAGEPPFDIFLRWKPLAEQPMGWNPDLDDGVRMNIRPFVEADILRTAPNIKWTKDRGKEPLRDKDEFPWFWEGHEFIGDRLNDIHLTNAEKQAAQKQSKVSK